MPRVDTDERRLARYRPGYRRAGPGLGVVPLRRTRCYLLQLGRGRAQRLRRHRAGPGAVRRPLDVGGLGRRFVRGCLWDCMLAMNGEELAESIGTDASIEPYDARAGWRIVVVACPYRAPPRTSWCSRLPRWSRCSSCETRGTRTCGSRRSASCSSHSPDVHGGLAPHVASSTASISPRRTRAQGSRRGGYVVRIVKCSGFSDGEGGGALPPGRARGPCRGRRPSHRPRSRR